MFLDGIESNSKFEDIQAIAQYMQLDTILEDRFDLFFTEILQNMNLASGKIYSNADLAMLKKKKRPAFQTNLFFPLLLRLAGDFKGNLPGIRIEGTKRDSYAKSDMMTDLNDNILYDVNDLTYEIAKAYITAQQTRIAFLHQRYDYSKSDEGDIILEWYPKFLKFDTSVTDRAFKTCQFIDDASWYSPEELIQIYAPKDSTLATEIYEKARAILGSDDRYRKAIASFAKRMLNVMLDYAGENVGYDDTLAAWDKHNDWHTPDGRFKAVDFYERKMFNSLTIYDRIGGYKYDVTDQIKLKDTGVNWFDRNKLDYIKQNFIADPEPHIEEGRSPKIWQTSVIPGLYLKVYEGEQQLKNGNFKFTPVLANDFHMDILQTKCMIDVTKDPVKSYNHRDNTNLTYLMRMAHGGAYIESRYAKKMEESPDTKIAGFTIVADGAIRDGGIQEKGVPPQNTAIVEYQLRKAEEVDKLAGIPLPARGNTQFAGESAKHFMESIAQGDVMQEWANENAQAALIQASKNNLWYIQNFYDEEREFKITQNRRNPFWLTINKQIGTEILNDVTVGKYEVRLSAKAFGRIAKESRKMQTLTMIDILLKLNPMLVNPQLVLDTFEPDNYDEWLAWIEKVTGGIESDMYLQQMMKFMQFNSGQQDLAGKKLNNARDQRNFNAESAMLGLPQGQGQNIPL